MRVFKRSVGIIVMGPIPDLASTNADQNFSQVLPTGVTTPIPVTTTRFIATTFAAISFSTMSATSPTVENGISWPALS